MRPSRGASHPSSEACHVGRGRHQADQARRPVGRLVGLPIAIFGSGASCHLWFWCQLPSLGCQAPSGKAPCRHTSSRLAALRRLFALPLCPSRPSSTHPYGAVFAASHPTTHTLGRRTPPPSLPLRRSLTLVLRLYSAAYACRRASTLRHMRRGGACPIGRAPPPTDRLVLVSLLYPTHTTVRPLGAPHASPVATSIGPPPRERGTPPPRERERHPAPSRENPARRPPHRVDDPRTAPTPRRSAHAHP